MDTWGGVYRVRIVARMFPSFCSVEDQRPLRRQSWRLKSEVSDYRAAQISGAVESADGSWYSRREGRTLGELPLWFPETPDLPSLINVEIRLARFPAHASVVWEEGCPYRKPPTRPPEGSPSVWYDVDYDPEVFTADIRRRSQNVSSPQFQPPKIPAAEHRTLRKSDTQSDHSDSLSKAPSQSLGETPHPQDKSPRLSAPSPSPQDDELPHWHSQVASVRRAILGEYSGRATAAESNGL